MRLHGYFRSSASYRVRIALNLKGLGAEHLPHHLRKSEQRYLRGETFSLAPHCSSAQAIADTTL